MMFPASGCYVTKKKNFQTFLGYGLPERAHQMATRDSPKKTIAKSNTRQVNNLRRRIERVKASLEEFNKQLEKLQSEDKGDDAVTKSCTEAAAIPV